MFGKTISVILGAAAVFTGISINAFAEGEAVKTTLDNLQAAYNGESNAKARYEAFAAMSFKGAMAAEIEHSKIYSQALKELDSWKEPGKTFLVCTVCGYTTMDQNIKQCPICSVPREKFEVFK